MRITRAHFNQGSSGSTYYSPDFKKNFYTLSFNQELADNFGVTAGLSRRQSDITRADYVSNDGIVAGRAQYKNVIDTALSKIYLVCQRPLYPRFNLKIYRLQP